LARCHIASEGRVRCARVGIVSDAASMGPRRMKPSRVAKEGLGKAAQLARLNAVVEGSVSGAPSGRSKRWVETELQARIGGLATGRNKIGW
jgi:hypothetical protein